MGRWTSNRRAFLAASGAVAGAVALGWYDGEDGYVERAGDAVDDLLPGSGRAFDERARDPPGFGPGDRPNADGSDPGWATRDHDVYVVCHEHPAADSDQYAAVVETMQVAADYHSSWRNVSIAVVDAGQDLPADEPAYADDAIFEYMRGNVGPYSTIRDVHLLVFDNPWFRVGRASGRVGWDVGEEPWSVAVVAAGLAGVQSRAYVRAMALHEVGHTLVRPWSGEPGEVLNAHGAGGTERDEDGRIRAVYPMSSSYVVAGDESCDVVGGECIPELVVDEPEGVRAPETFVGCTDNFAGAGFTDPLVRPLFWANRRTHDGTRCDVPPPDPADETPGFTEDELVLTVRERLR